MAAHHLKTLLLKNYLLYRRTWLVSLLELIIPILLSLLTISIRNDVAITNYPLKQYADTNESALLPGPDIVNSSFLKNCSTSTGTSKVVLSPSQDPIIQRMQHQLEQLGYETLMVENNDRIDQMVQDPLYGTDTDHPTICFAVVCNNSEGHYRYSLRFNITNSDDTTDGPSPDFSATFFFKFYPWALISPIKSGMLQTHNLMLNYILQTELSKVVNKTKIKEWRSKFSDDRLEQLAEQFNIDRGKLQRLKELEQAFEEQEEVPVSLNPVISPMVQEEYDIDMIENFLGGPIDLVTLLPLLLLYQRQTSWMLQEKEVMQQDIQKRIKETLRMMGMHLPSYFLAWFIHYFILYAIVGFAHSLVLYYVLRQVSFWLIYLTFLLFDIVLILQSFFVQTLCTQARTGVLIAFLLFAVQFLVSFVYKSNPVKSYGMALGVSVSPHAACILILKEMVYAQSVDQPVNFSNMSQMINFMTVWTGLLSLLLNIGFWALAFVYCQKVFPNQWGIKKHPLFFLKCFWGTNRTHQATSSAQNIIQAQQDRTRQLEGSESDIGVSSQNMILLDSVTKKYGDQGKAVDNLTLAMPRGEVFVLLGHNGAGKTTTLSMLSGLLEPTSGSITVFNTDLTTNIDQLRKRMGVCPQHNVLYDNLTVKEHLMLVGSLKGCSIDSLQVEVESLLTKVDLVDKTHYFAKDLSGGQKRRLSVAIAFIGGSEVIFLDEPTSGVDSIARRQLWQMIKDARQNRVIILTTHFMDQADFLGDQIAIMAQGKLICSGSSVFLKNKYGLGYTLTIVKQTSQVSSTAIAEYVSQFVPDCKLRSNLSLQVVMELPIASINHFAPMLEALDKDRHKLSIRTFGISIATLEDVFLRVAEQSNRFPKEEPKPLLEKDNAQLTANLGLQTHPRSFWRHCKATLLKRFRVAKRDPKTIWFEFYLPLFLIAFSIAILKIRFTGSLHEQRLDWSIFQKESLPFRFPVGGNVSDLIVDRLAGSINQDYRDYLSATAHSNYSTAAAFDRQVLLPIKSEFLKAAVFMAPPVQTGIVFCLLINTRSPTSPFLALTTVAQSIINTLIPHPITIDVVNAPLPLTYAQSNEKPALSGYLGGIAFTMALSLKLASVIAFIVRESTDKCKQQQMLSGMNVHAYWLSNFLYDYAMYLLVAVPTVIACVAFNVESLVADGAIVYTILDFVLFGAAALPFTYICSFLFKDYGFAQAAYCFFSLVVGAMLPTIIVILKIIGGSTVSIAEDVCWLLRMMPAFSFGEALIGMASKDDMKRSRGEELTVQQLAGWPILYLALSALILPVILLLVEKYSQRSSEGDQQTNQSNNIVESEEPMGLQDSNLIESTLTKNQDVDSQEKRVNSVNPKDCCIVVRGLTKTFEGSKLTSPKTAVNNVSFTVGNGEVFGLLGVNGAGKTTLFKILAGELQPTSGDAYFQGHHIFTNRHRVNRILGYCPQFDALLGKLTVKQQLELYYNLKDLPSELMEQTLSQLIKDTSLQTYSHVQSQNLSGGNKRKLSLACAMVGNPPVLLLDEPSSGMDPAARRLMWRCINKTVHQDRLSTVILTTHSMQEAEALSNRLTIMVAGQLRCIGSPQYVKSMFGQGYEVELKLTAITKQQINELLATVYERQKDLQSKTTISSKNVQQIVRLFPRGCELYASATNQIQLRKLMDQHHGISLEELARVVIGWHRELALRQMFGQLGESSDCLLIEHFQDLYRYRLGTSVPIHRIFSVLQSSRQSLKLSQYGVTQTSVQQVLHSFSSEQISHS